VHASEAASATVSLTFRPHPVSSTSSMGFPITPPYMVLKCSIVDLGAWDKKTDTDKQTERLAKHNASYHRWKHNNMLAE